jgi:hypothetical protein
MAEKINDAARDLQADALGDALDAGTLSIYSGSQPSSAEDSPSGTLLVTIALPADAFDPSSSGVIALSESIADAAVASDDAGWFRIESADNSLRYDGEVTATGDGGEIELDTITIVSGQTVTIDTFTITQPAS